MISANDDGGEGRNSRIERYLTAGVYLIEATTYLERDLQPLRSDFTLVIQLVDEEAEQRSFQLKVEATHAPDQVIAGVPFPVHYRVGNLGGGDLIETEGSVEVYVVAPGVYRPAGSIIPSDGRWPAGVSYHSGPQTASATSIENGEVTPMRHSPVDAAVNDWWISSAIEVDGNSIGYISSRRLADGRVELGFIRSDGEGATPDIRYLPADLPAGVWLRSGEIEAPPPAVLE